MQEKNCKDEAFEKEINYLKITSVELHGQKECENNKGIFASDHYGLCCEVEIKYL